MTFLFDDSENVRMLYDICCLMQSDEKLENTFSKALGIIQNIVGCDSASLFLYNEQEKRLTEAATVGTKMELIETSEFEMGARVSAWIAKKRDSVLLTDVCKNIPGEFRSFISFPLVSEDKFIGVIHVGHKDQNYFTETHLKCIEIIAGQLAHKIERSAFEKELIEKNTALEIAQKEIDKQHKQYC